MSLILNKHRNFDYLELSGLEKVTGVPAGRWHLYILKELLDNALDADEAAGLRPKAEVIIKHCQDTLGSWTLLVEVANLATFPEASVRQVARWDVYASSKDFVNGVTRGRQGNALKTLMGMPYALRHHTTGGYDKRLSPLMIDVNGRRYFLVLDASHSAPHAQVIVDAAPKLRQGTRVRLILPNYAPVGGLPQAEFIAWADQYAALNPFAAFDWQIEADGLEAIARHYSTLAVTRVVQRQTVIHWYDVAQFRRLCAALVGDGITDPAVLSKHFRMDSSIVSAILISRLRDIGVESLTRVVDNDSVCRGAFEVIVQSSPPPTIEGLEGLAAENLRSFALEIDEVEGEVVFETTTFTPRAQPHAPTTIQFAVWRSRRLAKRELWFGVNHTPLYRNPFQQLDFPTASRGDGLPSGEESSVHGLELWLDELGIDPQDNVRIWVHILSPNLRFQNFGKSEFDCDFLIGPLQDVASSAIGVFLEKNKLRPNEKVLLGELALMGQDISNEGQFRYTTAQLYFRARQRWEHLETQLAAKQRLTLDRFCRVVLKEYWSVHGPLKGLVGYSDAKFLHPGSHSNVVLWVLADGFEDVVIANNWNHQYGFALMWGDFPASKLGEELQTHFEANQRPMILAVHDTTAEQSLRLDVGRKSFLQKWISGHFVDLGLTFADAMSLNMVNRPLDELPSDAEAELQRLVDEGRLEKADQNELVVKRCGYHLTSLAPLQIKEWLAEALRRVMPSKRERTKEDLLEDWLKTRLERVVASQVTARILRRMNADLTAREWRKRVSDTLDPYRPTLHQRLLAIPRAQWQFETERFVEEILTQLEGEWGEHE